MSYCCSKTGNPCGTDTWSVCECHSCQAWIRDPATHVNIVREQLKSAAVKKHRPWFSPVSLPWGTDYSSWFDATQERNGKWAEEVTWIDTTCDRMIEMLKNDDDKR